ncbi:MAG: glycine--tRNA ligase subunit beta, partial [Quisquiliibacterium sp.]
ISSLTRASDGKQECFFHRNTQPGAALQAVIQELITQALDKLPIPKMMDYQLADGSTTVSFVRPAHRLVVLHGEKVLKASVLGLESDRITLGHRFQSTGELSIPDAHSYVHVLEGEGRVIPDFDIRRARIESMLDQSAKALDASLGESAAVEPLLDEVCA